MNKMPWFAFVSLLILLAVGPLQAACPDPGDGPCHCPDAQHEQPLSELVVELESALAPGVVGDLLDKTGLELVRQIGPSGRLFLVRSKDGQAYALDKRNSLRGDDRVTSADYNQVYSAAQQLSNDPYSPLQWALHNTGEAIGGCGDPDGYTDINAKEAWAKLPVNASTVKVAVLDTGMSLATGDLPMPAWSDAVRGAPTATDLDGHGTQVTSILAATTNNKVGMAGVAPKVDLMAIRVLGDHGQGTLDQLIEGIDTALAWGARVINLSLTACAADEVLQNRIEDNDEVLFVAAAGNHGRSLAVCEEYPAGFAIADTPPENLVAVSGVDPLGKRVATSNACADLSAPGECVYSWAVVSGGGVDLDWLTGTSAATALTSGVAALVLSKCPNLAPKQVKACLVGSAGGPMARDRLVNADKAMDCSCNP